jgi:hypothetical protein
VTIGVVVVLVLLPEAADAGPTGTIGVAGVEVLVESESDECVAGGGFWPLGMTMGVCLAFEPLLPPLPLLSLSESNCGGQSTDVGGQLSALPDPDELGGEHPEPAPKSPAVVQSAAAMPTGMTAKHPASENAAAAIRIREMLTASGCPRRR